MIEEAVASLLNDDGATANAYCCGMAIADLGCSSGPNTLALVSTAVDAVRRLCSELGQQPPELCIHLNDLPSNDFNSVIRSLTTYIKTQESFSPPVLTSIVPGSFHGRLFNKRSLHLVCSTASLHWLSKVSTSMRPTGSS
jgi:jasmonate O-methyltransferase